VTKALLEASIAGIGKYNLTSIFPISIFSYKKGVNANPGDPNYDLKKLAIKSLCKRIYPNFVNGDWTEAHEDENDIDTFMSTMGCRTMLGYDIHGLGYKRNGRGNINPTTIILPKLGIEYGICTGLRKEPDLKGFWKKFDEVIDITIKSLIWRFNKCAAQPLSSAPFIYDNKSMYGTEECDDGTVKNTLKHGTQAIGFIGISEMCYALFGKRHTDRDGDVYNFALQVVEKINKVAKEATEKYQLNFSCYATPAEGLCSTALRNLKKEYGEIEGITDKEWLTNSFHTDVRQKVSFAEKINLEAPFTKYATGGTITYVEVDGDPAKNEEAMEKLIDYAMNQNIPYFAINFKLDNCRDCGTEGVAFDNGCPKCGSKNINRLRRVTGYLTMSMENFNIGKLNETKNRTTHN